MKFAEVAVDVAATQTRTFSYSAPEGLSIQSGQAVWVPFGPRRLQGIVFELTDISSVAETRDIHSVIGSDPALDEVQLRLARWISDYYLSSLFAAAALMLPPGFEQHCVTYLHLTDSGRSLDLASLNKQQKTLLLLLHKGKLPASNVEKALGKKASAAVIAQFVRKGWLTRTFGIGRARLSAKTASFVHLAVSAEKAGQEADLRRKRAQRQADLLDFLIEHPGPISPQEILDGVHCSRPVLDSLHQAGLVDISEEPIQRDPMAHRAFEASSALKLTDEQQKAWEQICAALSEGRSRTEKKAEVFLLHGITGSGKTELYLRAVAEAAHRGKKAIVLVPEIALTPQTIDRFASRFPGRVAVLHSKLSPGEQFDEWQRIRRGECDVVIGSRGAIFAPQPDLGVIVIDEEHEWTYKQHDQAPRYHARDVALKLAELSGAIVILGSATPSLESYFRAEAGDFRLLRITERVHAGIKQKAGELGKVSLPDIDVIDLRTELRAGNRSIFSRSLTKAVNSALAAHEQVILFLNRRGAASFVQCRECGHVIRCRRCDIALTYHSNEERLVCHQCNYRINVPDTCPSCWSHRIKFLGIGTQKVEEEAIKAFPSARILRWDRDATKARHSHEQIMDKFAAHGADILIGTQMIAKGLDLPLVTVVGVISADVNLHLPDFRSAERTFQLLTQVAGRAGRGELGGRAIIQSYTPEHYAIAAAAGHDYAAFYERELRFRKEHGDPPFKRLARLGFTDTNAAFCESEAHRMHKLLKEERDSQGSADVDLIGPSPSYIERVRGKYRWQIIVRSNKPAEFLGRLHVPSGWTIDIDPMSLL